MSDAGAVTSSFFKPVLNPFLKFSRSMYSFLRCLLILTIAASCVPNRKVTLLQKDDLHAGDLPKDTVLREYHPQPFDYKIQPDDVISVRFESMTDEKYDFLSDKDFNQFGANLAMG